MGLCVERSLEMVVGILGILKAGGAYVPLDPESPEARLEYMLDDAGLEVVLTQSRLSGLHCFAGRRTIALDEAAAPGDQSPPSPRGLGSSHLAYMIYTSGSTGQPKGAGRASERRQPELPPARAPGGSRSGAGLSLGLERAGGLRRLRESLDPAGARGRAARPAAGRPAISAGPALLCPEPSDRSPGLHTVPAGAAAHRGGTRAGRAAASADRRRRDQPRSLVAGLRSCGAARQAGVERLRTDGMHGRQHRHGDGGSVGPHIGRPLPNVEAYVLNADLALVPQGRRRAAHRGRRGREATGTARP